MHHQPMLLVAGMAACLSSGAALCQSSTSTTTSSPIAYIYVNSYISSTDALIFGFAAAPNGQLTPLPGSPYSSSVNSLAINGKWLFGGHNDSQGHNPELFSYRINSNGSLSQADVLTKLDSGTNYSLIDLTLDHTGSSLYAGIAAGGGANGYDSFRINETSGQLTSLNTLTTAPNAYDYLTATGNNQYFYGATCYNYTPDIYGFQRTSSGALTQVATNAALPSSPSNITYCPLSTAADPYNDVVVPLAEEGSYGSNLNKYQLAVYTADTYGYLHTTSTYQNMPTTQVTANFVSMSPKGYYLAVTGSTGLQLFLMHGSKPLNALTGPILPGVSMGRAYWDNNEHLYVITPNRLYVFNISTNGVTQVPGSPYSIPSINDFVVLPR